MAQMETTTQPRHSHIANYILIAMVIILLLAYPFKDDFFFGGLLTHMAGAAVIGGLADWYAVTALFRKPLGISFKTALIPRSKERIAEMARHMIESEILTVSNMYNVLKHHPILETTLEYLHTEKGFQSAERVLGQILNTFLFTVDMQTVVKAFAGIGSQTIEKIDIAPMMAKALKIGLQGESGKDFLDFMLLNAEQLVRSDTMKKYIGDIYRESLRQYAERNFFLQWAIKAALASDMFSPEHVAMKLQKKALEVLAEAKEPDSPQREKALKYLWEQAERLEINASWQKRIEGYKMRMYQSMATRPDMREAWQRYVSNPDRQQRVCHVAADYAVTRLENWRKSTTNVKQMNRVALAFAARELKRLQGWFGATAEQEILKYDSVYLAQQLESSVWYDLQMIRVNGSFVGAILGTVIFLIMQTAKGGM
jgi:uncharacterized membrane-anchored protein YjiN (DUF445 family)